MNVNRWLKKHGYRLSFSWINKETLGQIDLGRRTIVINLDLFLVSIFLHEYFHHVYCEEAEQKILKRERRATNRLPVRTIRKLARQIRQSADRQTGRER